MDGSVEEGFVEGVVVGSGVEVGFAEGVVVVEVGSGVEVGFAEGVVVVVEVDGESVLKIDLKRPDRVRLMWRRRLGNCVSSRFFERESSPCVRNESESLKEMRQMEKPIYRSKFFGMIFTFPCVAGLTNWRIKW